MKKFYYVVAIFCLILTLNGERNDSDTVKSSSHKLTAQQLNKTDRKRKGLALLNAAPIQRILPTIGNKVSLAKAPTPVPTDTSIQTPTDTPTPVPTDTPTPAPTPDPNDSDPVHLGQELAASQYNWTGSQWDCLYQLWNNESGWNPSSVNPYSGATGIPQALPGSKILSAGYGYSAKGQILWGLGYIAGSYGNACNALGMWQSRYPHWY